jgi:hypothetical protein
MVLYQGQKPCARPIGASPIHRRAVVAVEQRGYRDREQVEKAERQEQDFQWCGSDPVTRLLGGFSSFESAGGE